MHMGAVQRERESAVTTPCTLHTGVETTTCAAFALSAHNCCSIRAHCVLCTYALRAVDP